MRPFKIDDGRFQKRQREIDGYPQYFTPPNR